MTDIVMCYVTFSDQKQAEEVAEKLVEEGLIACANVMGAITSVYHWQDRIEKTQEVAAFLKTSTQQLDRLKARFKSLHSYEVPCFLVIDVQDGLPDYLQWLKNELPG